MPDWLADRMAPRTHREEKLARNGPGTLRSRYHWYKVDANKYVSSSKAAAIKVEDTDTDAMMHLRPERINYQDEC